MSHIERMDFCRYKDICMICLKIHPYDGCPDRGRLYCGEPGCHSLSHHRLLHCRDRGTVSSEVWELTPPEEPIRHANHEGRALAGPSEMGLTMVSAPQQLDDSGISEPVDGAEPAGVEAERAVEGVAGSSGSAQVGVAPPPRSEEVEVTESVAGVVTEPTGSAQDGAAPPPEPEGAETTESADGAVAGPSGGAQVGAVSPPEPEAVMLTLDKETRIRAEALRQALARLQALEREERAMLGVGAIDTPPRARGVCCELCRKQGIIRPRHSLGDCPQFVALGISARERVAIKFACGVCLEVEHYTAVCPIARRECGIYGCRLPHHPLLHRIQYLEPLSPEDDNYCNWPRHQQARQDGTELVLKCTVCQDPHDTRDCPLWPLGGRARFQKAVEAWICVKCLRYEHAYCPAEQMICGVNGCNHHHDPFFHEGPAGQLVRVAGNFFGEIHGADSWTRIVPQHIRWTEERDITYQEKQICSHHTKPRRHQ